MSQPTRYAAVLAKIGAEKSKLLTEAKVKSLLESKDLASFAAQLQNTDYQPQIIKVPPKLTSRKLERAFTENLIESYVKLIKNSPEEAALFLSAYVLRFEIENLKVLIKAVNSGLVAEDRLGRIYFSAEDFLRRRPLMEELAKAYDLRQMQNSLRDSIYQAAFNSGMQTYEEKGSTSAFDISLDRVFYDKIWDAYWKLPKKDRSHALFYAATENDGFTLLMALRGKALSHSENWLKEAVPLKNFKLPSATLEALLTAPDFESAFRAASRTSYGKYLVRGSSQEETLAAAERAFRIAVFEHAKAGSVSEIFNVGAALAFMMVKEAEVHNLIAMSAGVEGGVAGERIQSQLLL